MKKTTLLATVAAAALFGATPMALAQGMGGDQRGSQGQGATGAKPSAAEHGTVKPNAGPAAAPGARQSQHGTTGQSTREEHGDKAGRSARDDKGMKDHRSTTGQGAAHEERGDRSGAGMKPGADTKSNTEMQRGQSSERNSTSTSTSKSTKGGGSVTLNQEQKTKIRTTVLEGGHAPKMSRSDIHFTLNVGTAVPRSVHFVDVPPTLVEIHPAWRGFRYFVVDEEIVIIDPATLQIVAIVTV